MKDKHIINLILISSRWFNSFLPEIVHDEVILGSSDSSFLFRSSKFSQLYRREASSKSSQGFTLCFKLLFLLSSFYYRSSSWRLNMVVRQGFLSFFNCSSRFLSELRSAKLYSKINMVFNTCFVLRSSSILHLAFRSAILSLLSFEVVLCPSWQFPSMFHVSHVVKNEIF